MANNLRGRLKSFVYKRCQVLIDQLFCFSVEAILLDSGGDRIHATTKQNLFYKFAMKALRETMKFLKI